MHEHWPKAAASAVVLSADPSGDPAGDRVLLVERGKGAPRGLWSFPGGHVEAGERVRDAAVREVLEETGLAIEISGLIDVHDVILRRPDGVMYAHYVLSVFAGRMIGDAAALVAGGDVMDVRFVAVDALREYRLTDGAADVVARVRGYRR